MNDPDLIWARRAAALLSTIDDVDLRVFLRGHYDDSAERLVNAGFARRDAERHVYEMLAAVMASGQ